jgi:hypothetical protein
MLSADIKKNLESNNTQLKCDLDYLQIVPADLVVKSAPGNAQYRGRTLSVIVGPFQRSGNQLHFGLL